jgi:hypothetical protein
MAAEAMSVKTAISKNRTFRIRASELWVDGLGDEDARRSGVCQRAKTVNERFAHDETLIAQFSTMTDTVL